MPRSYSGGWSGYDAYSTTATSAATTTESEDSRALFINDRERNAQFEYPNNKIRTSHYTMWNFVFITLYEQFSKLANAYFLVMACLTLIPTISPVHPWSSFMPLVFVITTSMIREAVEDYFRHRQDNEINHRIAFVLNTDTHEWYEEEWINVMPGDIVLVEDGGFLPADLLALVTSTDDGSCTVETRNLDGESNLKPKKAVEKCQELGDDLRKLSKMRGSLHYELPNNRLYAFNGSFEYKAPKAKKATSIPVTAKEVLLRGSMLKGTQWVIGLVVYTGHETKLMMNATKTKTKRSRVDRLMSKYLVVIMIFEFLVVFGSATAAVVLHLFILLSALIPISLYVSVEMVKVVQSLQINVDKDMYYEPTSKPARARTSNLTEELGQVKYNRMDFIKCSIGGVSYGTGITEAARAAQLRAEGKDAAQLDWHELQEEASSDSDSSSYDSGYGSSDVESSRRASSASTQSYALSPASYASESGEEFDPTMLKALDKGGDHGEDIDLFVTLLAVCNTVDPRKAKPEEAHKSDVYRGIRYQAASPDEAALVKAAAQFFDYRLVSRSGSNLTVLARGEKRKYKVLNVLEFDSDRKRMSVIVRMPDSRIMCLTKGADSVIYKLVNNAKAKVGRKTDSHLTTFSEEGLRTLACAYRELSDSEYKAWNKRYTKAALDVLKRDELIAEVSQDMETDLTLLGATGIEDKLQDGVPRTIATLAHASIKIWVLTGDKQETAINIGYACALLDQEMNILVVNTTSFEETHDVLKSYIRKYSPERNAKAGRYKNNALVMDGKSLAFVLSAPETQDLLYELGLMCVSVIFCRVSPLQKANVVGLVRARAKNDVTLAIGDGANDVSMITEAHVGVGIAGEEGMQAVLASDYAVGQFRFLQKLLLVHGRWSYRRVVKLILYSFQKNAAFNLTQLWFNIFAGMSGQTLLSDAHISFFNLTFTGLPIMLFAVFDQDVNSRGSQLFPQLYTIGQKDGLFNLHVFVAWFFEGIFQSLILFFLPMAAYYAVSPHESGRLDGLHHFGALVYVCIIIAANVKHARPEWGTHFGLSEFLDAPITWLLFILVPFVALLPGFIVEYVQVNFFPTKIDVVRKLRISRTKGDLSDETIGHIEAALAAHTGNFAGATISASGGTNTYSDTPESSGSTRWDASSSSDDDYSSYNESYEASASYS
ncbi:P-type ATPase [Thecamonas trahens ATCC 50062]|uniref:Phospholipid-transporting ATPase n=1 Tax=Thecamonas trahens ATCC 50062 TaxID=461836 RepID=A0A0L0DDD3_THETB|nr:P-type ATPase [Thecamonas trahens ATCC 50062]KNC50339.1 P-type ATPase [Thecamonas trahens ATCC 50062]|eukprot:XP_013756885.1 P-type ATPase [Thecamonas trahens ATCC 50062]